MSKPFFLNIGLDRFGKTTLDWRAVLAAVDARFTIRAFRLVEASVDNEPTAVFELAHDGGGILDRVEALCVELEQEAIAVYIHGYGGRLVGPKAAEWGLFNPALFTMIDGRRLSERRI